MLQYLISATGEPRPAASWAGTPVAERIPTPMLPVANRPVATYAVELCARHGAKSVLVAVRHLAGAIEAHFADGRRWGVHLDYVLQRDSLGSAGALKFAEPRLTTTTLVVPADSLLDLDIDSALAVHQRTGATLTLILRETDAPSRRQAYEVDAEGTPTMVAGDSGARLVSTGACIFEPTALAQLAPRQAADIDQDLAPALVRAGLRVRAYVEAGYGNALDTPGDLAAAQRDLLRSAWHAQGSDGPALPVGPLPAHPFVSGRVIAPGIWVEPGASIHPTAALAPPVCIGANCQVGHNVLLGPSVAVGRDCIIDEEATIADSTIFARTYVGRLVDLRGRIVDRATVVDAGSGEVVQLTDRFLLDETAPVEIGGSLRRLGDLVIALGLLVATMPVWLVVAVLLLIAGKPVMSGLALARSGAEADRVGNRVPMRYRFGAIGPGGQASGIGRWLARAGIARLPELWSVVRGDLARIGVRPLTPDEVAGLRDEWERQHLDVRPGLTGAWYVDTAPGASLTDELVADAYHVVTRSWRRDVRLALRTPGAWWRRRARPVPERD